MIGCIGTGYLIINGCYLYVLFHISMSIDLNSGTKHWGYENHNVSKPIKLLLVCNYCIYPVCEIIIIIETLAFYVSNVTKFLCRKFNRQNDFKLFMNIGPERERWLYVAECNGQY